ncbi:MAG: hypothetical protein LQ348_004851 [Seirophora lacunosa]|nr:MAG: hypothetical protein LQ348_004851 [Seirophora lacunosa]
MGKMSKAKAKALVTGETVDLWIWNANEIFALIVAACIPTLRPLFLIILKRPSSEAFRHHKKSHHSHSGSSHRAHNTKIFHPPNEWRIIDSGPTNETWFDDASESRIVPEHDSRIRQTIELNVTSQPKPPSPVLRSV